MMRYLCGNNISHNCWNNYSLSLQVERCMQSHLKTFASTLEALNTPSKIIARKLAVVNTYKNILPEVSLTLWYSIAQYSAKAVQ